MIVLMISVLSTSVLTANASGLSSNGLKASRYINSCNAQITTGSSGKILLDGSVIGTNVMDTIGVQTLIIQKYQSGSWVNVTSWSDLYDYNSASSAFSATYYGSVGTQYRAVITFYASLSGGSDSRIMTTTSVTAVS